MNIALRGILIAPVGKVEPDILSAIADGLGKTFHLRVESGGMIPIPEHSFNSRRIQYHSTTILKTLSALRTDDVLLLGVVDADLYVPQLNFVFGEADTSGGVAIISLTRLRQEFYGLKPDENLFQERAVKEAIHELGHTYGLGHCNNPRCIMFFSNSLGDTDLKGPEFCMQCGEKLNRTPFRTTRRNTE